MEKKSALKLLFISIAIYIAAVSVLSLPGILSQEYGSVLNDVNVTVIRADGTFSYASGKYFPVVSRGDRVVAEIHLPTEKYIKDAAICVNVYNSVISLYYRDALLATYGKEAAESGWQIGNVALRASLPEAAWGDSVRLVCDVQEDDAFSELQRIYVVDRLDSLRYFQVGHEVEFIVLVSIFAVFGLIFLVLLVQSDKTGIVWHGIFLSLFCVSFSIWMLAYNGLLNILIAWQPLVSILEYVSIYFAPIPFCLYLWTSERIEAYKKIDIILSAFFGGVFLLATAGNFFTFAHHYSQYIKFFNALLLFGNLIVLYMMFHREGEQDTREVLVRYGIGTFMVTMLVEILRYNLMKFFGVEIPLLARFGTTTGMVVLLFALSMSYLYHLMDHIISRREKEDLERMAYTDALTGMPNRAACFRYMKTISQAQDYAIAFFDLNDLKKANDLSGHEAGDDMIKNVGAAITYAFSHGGFAARVGGDEYVGIIPRGGKAEIERALLTFRRKLDEYNDRSSLGFRVAVSCGISVNDPAEPRSIESRLNDADEKMYEQKMAYKRAHFREAPEDRLFIREDKSGGDEHELNET